MEIPKPFPLGPWEGSFPDLLTGPGRGTTRGEKAEGLEPDMTHWAPTRQKAGPGRQEQRKLQAGGEQTRGGGPEHTQQKQLLHTGGGHSQCGSWFGLAPLTGHGSAVAILKFLITATAR